MRHRTLISALVVAVTGAVQCSAPDANAQMEPSPGIQNTSAQPEQPSTAAPERAARKPGPEIGLRVGYALGGGVIYSGLTLSDTMNGAVPIQLDVLWRFLPELYAGIYGQFAPVFRKNDPTACPENFSCSSQDWRFGVEGEYHFLPRIDLNPYVGLGAGYEILHSTASGATPIPTSLGSVSGNANVSSIDRGWEFASFIVGFDWRLTAMLNIGPYLSGSIGEFDVHSGTETLSAGGESQSTPLPAVTHAAHELASLGIRGTFGL